MTKQFPSLTDKQRFWLAHIQACERAGQSMRQYADAHALAVGTLYSWKATLQRLGVLDAASPSPALFQQAQLIEHSHTGQCRLALPTGLSLEFDSAVDPDWVAALIRALAP